METFHAQPQWAARLAAAGLASHAAALAHAGGECLSEHPDRRMLRETLPSGETVFVKQIFRASPEYLLKQLLAGRAPRVNTEYERRVFAALAALGFAVPEVAAWGYRSVCGVQVSGSMVLLPLDGVSLEDYLKTGPAPEARQNAIARCEAALAKLQERGFDWKRHCKPEHFFLMREDPEKIGLIDLESMAMRRAPLGRDAREAQFARFRSLLPAGA